MKDYITKVHIIIYHFKKTNHIKRNNYFQISITAVTYLVRLILLKQRYSGQNVSGEPDILIMRA